MTSNDDFKRELQIASRIKNPALRGVTLASIIAEALRTIGQDPILVGGAAVEFYSEGGYSTEDIDMVTEGGPELAQLMDDLGFEKIGKDYFNDAQRIYLKFPGSSLGPHEKFALLKIGPRNLRIISREDLIVDRLCAFVYWKSTVDGKNALLLLESSELDPEHLLNRAKEEKVLHALEAIESLKQDIIRKKIKKQQAEKLLEKLLRNKP